MQLVTCLAIDVSLTADQGVASSIPAWSYTFVEIDREIISMVILLLTIAVDLRRKATKQTNKQRAFASHLTFL